MAWFFCRSAFFAPGPQDEMLADAVRRADVAVLSHFLVLASSFSVAWNAGIFDSTVLTDFFPFTGPAVAFFSPVGTRFRERFLLVLLRVTFDAPLCQVTMFLTDLWEWRWGLSL